MSDQYSQYSKLFGKNDWELENGYKGDKFSLEHEAGLRGMWIWIKSLFIPQINSKTSRLQGSSPHCSVGRGTIHLG